MFAVGRGGEGGDITQSFAMLLLIHPFFQHLINLPPQYDDVC